MIIGRGKKTWGKRTKPGVAGRAHLYTTTVEIYNNGVYYTETVYFRINN